MIGHSLELEDLRKISSPKKIVALFEKLGYNFQLENLDIEQLELPSYWSETIYDAYKIHNDEEDDLEVFLLELGLEALKTNPKLQEKIITIYQILSKSKKKNYSFVRKTIIS
ncbi:MAG: hypothetical protein F6K40_02100 [Okeania sp. SIO3I5]|uniref:hypothetical protein n=1 Tax=Okeania sp. SIO3I5 TaxID=2607805 RepID=UPI0013B7E21A|nr:hypothetical protein [Okeania sp. SIO3I5]NEQ35166.1 hypothetical protein [Okeania sp. SIO3I5]